MAWTTPSTAVAGSTALTAAFWNEQVRDNLNATRAAQINVKSVAKTNTTSISSGTFADIADLSVTITPSSSSSYFLVIANLQGSTQDVSSGIAHFRLTRSLPSADTVFHVGDANGSSTRSSGNLSSRIMNTNVAYTAAWHVLDTYAHAGAAVTYKVQWRSNAGTAYLNRSSTFLGTATDETSGVSTLTVMEIPV